MFSNTKNKRDQNVILKFKLKLKLKNEFFKIKTETRNNN